MNVEQMSERLRQEFEQMYGKDAPYSTQRRQATLERFVFDKLAELAIAAQPPPDADVKPVRKPARKRKVDS